MRIEELLNEAPGCSDTTANSSHKSARMALPTSTLSGPPPKTSTKSPSQVPQGNSQTPETEKKRQLGKRSSGRGDNGKTRLLQFRFTPGETAFLLALCERHRDENNEPQWRIITYKHREKYGPFRSEQSLKMHYSAVQRKMRAQPSRPQA